MNKFRRSVAKRLRSRREQLDQTQYDLAQKTGLLPSAISHFESGRRMPTLANLLRLADALDVSADYILGRKNAPIPENGCCA